LDKHMLLCFLPENCYSRPFYFEAQMGSNLITFPYLAIEQTRNRMSLAISSSYLKFPLLIFPSGSYSKFGRVFYSQRYIDSGWRLLTAMCLFKSPIAIRSCLVYCVQFWSLQYRKDIDKVQ